MHPCDSSFVTLPLTVCTECVCGGVVTSYQVTPSANLAVSSQSVSMEQGVSKSSSCYWIPTCPHQLFRCWCSCSSPLLCSRLPTCLRDTTYEQSKGIESLASGCSLGVECMQLLGSHEKKVGLVRSSKEQHVFLKIICRILPRIIRLHFPRIIFSCKRLSNFCFN